MYYLANDLQNAAHCVLVKISTCSDDNKKEYEVLKQLRRKDPLSKDFPRVHCGGEFIINDNFSLVNAEHAESGDQLRKRHSFFVMDHFGQNLQQHLVNRGKAFSLKTVCQLGIQLITKFQQIHSMGLVYNDLKLDNVLVGDQFNSAESLGDIRLLDFGLCTTFVDAISGQHTNLQNQTKFVGNMAMSSVNAMNFLSVSRRDDLISLTYLLIYMIQGRLSMFDVQHLPQS